MLQRRVAGFGAVQIETLQLLPVLDRGDAFVSDVLGEVKVKIGDAAAGL